MESIKNWMRDTANILFDDSKNDLRSLPKTVRLQILLVLSFIWTTVFSLYIFSYKGIGGMFSLDNGTGRRFLTKSEICLVVDNENPNH